MKKSILFAILIIANVAFGQVVKLIEIPNLLNADQTLDTFILYKSTEGLRRQINLPDLLHSTDTFHFRFWTDIQALDIWTVDFHSFKGMITNFAQRYNQKLFRKGEFEVDKIFSNQVILDSPKARSIFGLLDSLSITNIPTDNQIPGWGVVFDGQQFIIEISTPCEYHFRTYDTPRMFADSIKEAKQIQAFIDKLLEEYQLHPYYQQLKLPQGSYKRNGIQGLRIINYNEIGARTSIFDYLR